MKGSGANHYPRAPAQFTKYTAHTINSLSASLLVNIFLSFEVGIAHAIANFKWKENTSSLKNKPAKFHNGGFTQDLYMHICSISVKF